MRAQDCACGMLTAKLLGLRKAQLAMIPKSKQFGWPHDAGSHYLALGWLLHADVCHRSAQGAVQHCR